MVLPAYKHYGILDNNIGQANNNVEMVDNNFFSKFPNLQKINNLGVDQASDEEIMGAAIEIWRKFGREILMLNKEDFPKIVDFKQFVNDPKLIAILGRPVKMIAKVKHVGPSGREYYIQQLEQKYGIQFNPNKYFFIPVPTNLMGTSFVVAAEYPTI